MAERRTKMTELKRRAAGAAALLPPLSGRMWGGPVASKRTVPSARDSFMSTATCHGLPRAYDTSNGLLRSLFWLLAYTAGLIAVAFGSISIVQCYVDYVTVYSSYEDGSSGARSAEMPNLTFCDMQPVSCHCSLWYEEQVLNNLEFTYPLLSLMCPAAFETPFYLGVPAVLRAASGGSGQASLGHARLVHETDGMICTLGLPCL